MITASIGPVPAPLVAEVIQQCCDQGWSLVTTIFAGMGNIQPPDRLSRGIIMGGQVAEQREPPQALHYVIIATVLEEFQNPQDIKAPVIKIKGVNS